MGLLSVGSRQAREVRPDEQRARRSIRWLVPVCYLAIAVVLTWRVWADPAERATNPGGSLVVPDSYLTAWFMRYAATAVVHARLPALITTAVNYPRGINLMWNTSLLLPAVLLTPVTLLAGPMVSILVLLTVGFAGSATAMYVLLRRWGSGVGAAVVGGACYGFSPAMLVAAQDHYHLQFAVLPPLIIDALLTLVTGRGGPVRTGAWLGVLVTAQLFIAEEILADTALAGLILVIVLAASRPRAVPARLRGASAGLATTAGLTLLLAGYPLWIQARGPLTEAGSPWPAGGYGNQPADYVTAPHAMLLHGPHFIRFLQHSGQRLVEYFGYLGWPLLALLLLIAVWGWRDLRIRVATLCFTLLELLSMGGHRVHIGRWHLPAVLPWRLLWHLPVLSQMLPNRIAILADGAGAAMLAFGIDRALALAPRAGRWRKPAVALAAALTIGALVPIIPQPISAATVVPVPRGWDQLIAGLRLKPWAPVLVLPGDAALTMQWQAQTGVPISVVGGYCVVPDAERRAAECDSHRVLFPAQLTALLGLRALSGGLPLRLGPSRRVMLTAIAEWRPAAIVTADGADSQVARYARQLLGPPDARSGAVLGWRLHGSPPRLAVA